ncbi:MAG: hypothetical protein ACK5PF_11925 [bacterium]
MRAAAMPLSVCALTLAPPTLAQSLGEPPAIMRVLEISQFGLPRDARYVFCDTGECPARSTKSFTVAPIARVATAPAPPQPASPPSAPVAETLSHAKVQTPTLAPKTKPTTAPKRRPATCDCPPVTPK